MKTLSILAAAGLAAVAAPAAAVTLNVDALTHSVDSGAGTGLNTGLSFTLGQAFTLSSSTNDLWSAGDLPRFSDANGLTGDRFATALDDSGQSVGTQIGQDFGLFTASGFSAPYGTLVGRIGGVYQLLGANFAGPAWNTGTLELFYWDSFSTDNTGSIAFDIVSAVPEPAVWGMMIAGFGIAGAALRRGTRKPASV